MVSVYVPPALVLSPAGNKLSLSSFGGLHVCLHEHSPVTAGSVQLIVAEPTLPYTLGFSRGFYFVNFAVLFFVTVHSMPRSHTSYR